MATNLDLYKKDLDLLVEKGGNLSNAMQRECFPEQFESVLKKYGNDAKKIRKTIPSFKEAYQPWYSESKALVRQLLPDRLSDFVRFYEKPKSRKEITHANYVIEDYLQGLSVTRTQGLTEQKIVGPESA